MGSEVSYPTILDTLPSLVDIITSTLSSTGVFYLIQSANRGTSLYFINELCHKHNFLLDMRLVSNDELSTFSSGQREETYVYYTFRRQNSPYPIMGDFTALPLNQTMELVTSATDPADLRKQQYIYWSQNLKQPQAQNNNLNEQVNNEMKTKIIQLCPSAVAPPGGLTQEALDNINTAPYFGELVVLNAKTAQ